jgi:formylglycine-generating enzyme required for sulfatase activity
MMKSFLVFSVLLLSHSAHSSVEWITVHPKQVDIQDAPAVTLNMSSHYVTTNTAIGRLEPFDIMRTEFSCKQFLKVMVSLVGKREQQLRNACDDYPLEPITGVTLQEAELACASLGGELPSEYQWLAAALYRGSVTTLSVKAWYQTILVREYQENEQATSTMARDYKVDVEDAYSNLSGIKGLVGNVWEMTRSQWSENDRQYVMKGGAFDLMRKPMLLNPAYRAGFNPESVLDENVGFRCIKQ